MCLETFACWCPFLGMFVLLNGMISRLVRFSDCRFFFFSGVKTDDEHNSGNVLSRGSPNWNLQSNQVSLSVA